jgi:hypothetical protein
MLQVVLRSLFKERRQGVHFGRFHQKEMKSGAILICPHHPGIDGHDIHLIKDVNFKFQNATDRQVMVRDKLHATGAQVKSESIFLGFAPILDLFQDFFIFYQKEFNGDLDRNPGVIPTVSGYFGFRHFPLLLSDKPCFTRVYLFPSNDIFSAFLVFRLLDKNEEKPRGILQDTLDNKIHPLHHKQNRPDYPRDGWD